MKKFSIVLLSIILCVVSILPVGAKTPEEISENEFDARLLFTKYATAMTAFSGCYNVNGLNNLDFNGAADEKNADRILATSIYLEYASKKEGLKFIQNSNGNFAFTTDEARELVSKYYTVVKTDFTKSTFYNKGARKVVITEDDMVSDFSMPTIFINQDNFSFSVEDSGNGVIFATLKGWVIAGDNSGSGYMEIVVQVPSIDLSKAKFENSSIASVKVSETIPPLEFAPGNDYRKMDMGNYKYLAPGTSVSDALAMISANTVKSNLAVYDAEGNAKTEGIVGTGDYITDGENSTSPWNYIVLVVENDINGDGKVSGDDYTAFENHFNGKTRLNDVAKFNAADLVRDGHITSNDYMKAKKIFKITE